MISRKQPSKEQRALKRARREFFRRCRALCRAGGFSVVHVRNEGAHIRIGCDAKQNRRSHENYRAGIQLTHGGPVVFVSQQQPSAQETLGLFTKALRALRHHMVLDDLAGA